MIERPRSSILSPGTVVFRCEVLGALGLHAEVKINTASIVVGVNIAMMSYVFLCYMKSSFPEEEAMPLLELPTSVPWRRQIHCKLRAWALLSV